MGAMDSLAAIRAAGIKLSADGGGIRAEPRSALTPDLRARIRAEREGILAILRGESRTIQAPSKSQPGSSALHEFLEERAAILEFDASLSRDDAEKLARRDAGAKLRAGVERVWEEAWRGQRTDEAIAELKQMLAAALADPVSGWSAFVEEARQ